jgi:predicted dehydrogenase
VATRSPSCAWSRRPSSEQTLPNPCDSPALEHIGSTGVDIWACAHLEFESVLTAVVSCGVQAAGSNDVRIVGSGGRLEVKEPWVPQAGTGAALQLTRAGHDPLVLTAPGVDQFAADADAVARDLGRRESAEMTWADILGNATVPESWRRGID